MTPAEDARIRKLAAHAPALYRFQDEASFAALLRKAETPAQLLALVWLLAGAADPRRLSLLTGFAVPLTPSGVPLDPREAHRIYEQHRRRGGAVHELPEQVRRAERLYQSETKRRQREEKAKSAATGEEQAA